MRKKPLSWKILLGVGILGHTIVYLMHSNNVFINGAGVIFDIMFLLGIINLITVLVKCKKK